MKPNTTAQLPNDQDLAYAFARLLREELNEAEMGIVIGRNGAETDARICHSHDFCDANMVMAAAWEELTGARINLQDEAARVRWSEAWTLAKASDFETDCVTDEERGNGPRRR